MKKYAADGRDDGQGGVEVAGTLQVDAALAGLDQAERAARRRR